MSATTVNTIIVGFFVITGICLVRAYYWGKREARKSGASDADLDAAFGKFKSTLVVNYAVHSAVKVTQPD